jgi:hypothetical protein
MSRICGWLPNRAFSLPKSTSLLYSHADREQPFAGPHIPNTYHNGLSQLLIRACLRKEDGYLLVDSTAHICDSTCSSRSTGTLHSD